MNIFLAEHFCEGNGKEIEIIETVFATSKYRFDSKRDTIQAILSNAGDKYKVDGKLLCKDLQEIAYKRNIFAHYPLDIKEDSVIDFKEHGVFNFLKIENSTKKVKISYEEIEILKTTISATLHKISNLIPRRTSPVTD